MVDDYNLLAETRSPTEKRNLLIDRKVHKNPSAQHAIVVCIAPVHSHYVEYFSSKPRSVVFEALLGYPKHASGNVNPVDMVAV